MLIKHREINQYLLLFIDNHIQKVHYSPFLINSLILLLILFKMNVNVFRPNKEYLIKLLFKH